MTWPRKSKAKRRTAALVNYLKTAARNRLRLPTNWTPAQFRVDQKGDVKLKVNPRYVNPGKGGSFARCVKAVEGKGGAYDPNAVCAASKRRTAKGARELEAASKAARRGNAGKLRQVWHVWDDRDEAGTLKHFSTEAAARRWLRKQPEEQQYWLRIGPAAVPARGNPKGLREAEAKARETEQLTGRKFKVVRVTYSGGRQGWDITPRKRRASGNRRNPKKRSHLYQVSVPATAHDSGYTLKISAESKRGAKAEARKYCAGSSGLGAGYRLPSRTTVKELKR